MGTVSYTHLDVYKRQDKKPVDSAIVQSCQEHMERLRPIGAQVTVESAGAFSVSVAAALQLAEGAVLETVKAEFLKKLEEYFQELALQKNTVPYNRARYHKFLFLG